MKMEKKADFVQERKEERKGICKLKRKKEARERKRGKEKERKRDETPDQHHYKFEPTRRGGL
jgi:hypothetical protein